MFTGPPKQKNPPPVSALDALFFKLNVKLLLTVRVLGGEAIFSVVVCLVIL